MDFEALINKLIEGYENEYFLPVIAVATLLAIIKSTIDYKAHKRRTRGLRQRSRPFKYIGNVILNTILIMTIIATGVVTYGLLYDKSNILTNSSSISKLKDKNKTTQDSTIESLERSNSAEYLEIKQQLKLYKEKNEKLRKEVMKLHQSNKEYKNIIEEKDKISKKEEIDSKYKKKYLECEAKLSVE